MSTQGRLTAIIVTLVASAIISLAITAAVSYFMLRLGIGGFVHTVALMVIMPLAFAGAALFLARKLLLTDTRT